MPTFTIETPSGRKLTIEAPDQDTALRGAREWEQSQGQGGDGSIASDVAKSSGTGLIEGMAAIPGMIGDLPFLADKLAAWGVGQTAGRLENFVNKGTFEAIPGSEVQQRTHEIESRSSLPMAPKPWDVINSRKVLDWAKPLTGELHEPHTTTGKYARTITSFVPSALAGGGSALKRIANAVIPGAASEEAGQVTEGTSFETPARIGAALLAGGGTDLASRAGAPERMLQQAATKIDPPTFNKAFRLMDEARLMGVQLTWPEAIQQVTSGGTRLGDLQRVVEGTEAGGNIMKPFYAERPQQVSQAIKGQLEQINNRPLPPEQIGPRMNKAATGEIAQTELDINRTTRPSYQRAQNVSLNDPALSSPAYKDAIKRIRADPILGPKFKHLPDNSVGMIDAAQKLMEDSVSSLNIPGQDLNRLKATIVGSTREKIMSTLR